VLGRRKERGKAARYIPQCFNNSSPASYETGESPGVYYETRADSRRLDLIKRTAASLRCLASTHESPLLVLTAVSRVTGDLAHTIKAYPALSAVAMSV
jgi:hypothetical protein